MTMFTIIATLLIACAMFYAMHVAWSSKPKGIDWEKRAIEAEAALAAAKIELAKLSVAENGLRWQPINDYMYKVVSGRSSSRILLDWKQKIPSEEYIAETKYWQYVVECCKEGWTVTIQGKYALVMWSRTLHKSRNNAMMHAEKHETNHQDGA